MVPDEEPEESEHPEQPPEHVTLAVTSVDSMISSPILMYDPQAEVPQSFVWMLQAEEPAAETTVRLPDVGTMLEARVPTWITKSFPLKVLKATLLSALYAGSSFPLVVSSQKNRLGLHHGLLSTSCMHVTASVPCHPLGCP